MRTTPIRVLYMGSLWVKVFFIISGFVLPLRYFKTGKASCVTGGTFRRYFRLMIPMLIIISIYYFFMRMDCFGDSTYNKIKDHVFSEVLYDGLVGTWFGGTRWFFPAWTLSTELYASFWVYLLAEIAREFRGRFYIYFAMMMWTINIEIAGELSPKDDLHCSGIELNMPFFVLGVALADLETSEYKTFDKLR